MKGRGNRIENPRELAILCMHEVASRGLLVPEAMNKLAFKGRDEDQGLAHEIVYGGFRYWPGLDKLLSHKLKKGPPPKLYWLFIASLYQLLFMRTPAYAVLDQANRLAVKMGFPGLKGLVNGVLRKVDREQEKIQANMTIRDWLLPDWLYQLFEQQYGAAETECWLNSWRDRPTTAYWPLSTPLTGDQTSSYLPNAFVRETPIPLEAMTRGGIYIQNESSQAVAELIRRSGGSTVLDLCAAPGGKACYLAAFAKDVKLTACDVSPQRMAQLEANQNRLGLKFETHCCEAGALDLPENAFDRVLVDAPCSGIGIIGRHPEIKFLRKSPSDQEVRLTQKMILDQGWRFVKPGGYLLYTVCSLDERERPDPPDDAILAPEELAQWLPELPGRVLNEKGFHIAPTRRFDGFLGFLIRKPAS